MPLVTWKTTDVEAGFKPKPLGSRVHLRFQPAPSAACHIHTYTTGIITNYLKGEEDTSLSVYYTKGLQPSQTGLKETELELKSEELTRQQRGRSMFQAKGHHVYSFPMTGMIKHNKLRGLKQHTLIIICFL